MYRRPKFLEALLEIRRAMSLEANYDVELFAELARSGKRPAIEKPWVVDNTEEDSQGPEVEIPRLIGTRDG